MKTKRFLSVLLAISTIIVSMISFTVSASADKDGWITPLKNGEETTVSLDILGWKYSELYRIKMEKSGELTITVKSNLYKLCMDIETNNMRIINPDKIESSLGSVEYQDVEGKDAKIYTLKWNSSKKKYEGKITYKLDKGSYILRLYKVENIYTHTSNNVTFKVTYPSSDAKITCLAIPMKVGDTLQLDAALSKKSDDKISWKSSKSSVAKVSSKGLVTAKSKGTATITAYIRESKLQIKIKVK